ncbi:Oidioi.mRNA.OKI2018_I69.chr1.g1427.t1.cds [Oikopleura dioica]|uniref:Oidioi.mRNA.OKI2018_I69.chr1.g1427.t1.cds n=1 Tax=Oikopleura dioica TaxID=34765 RepID=A0ABN7ST36_OIKDI|nr:Oidioi.mRNA.OKI2018_I69.chr1.g1427.t1.cds [Oikopleura dioica]
MILTIFVFLFRAGSCIKCECLSNTFTSESSGKIVINTTHNSCPYTPASSSDDPHDENRITSFFDEETKKYFCEVNDGFCFEKSHWRPINRTLDENGYPCHERNCSVQLYSVKGCAKRETENDGYEHMCSGKYGEDLKRKDGSFLLKRDFEMTGIAHVPLASYCDPICTGLDWNQDNSKIRNHQCSEERNICSFSRIFCCEEDLCNTEERKRELYFGKTFHQWQDRS